MWHIYGAEHLIHGGIAGKEMRILVSLVVDGPVHAEWRVGEQWRLPYLVNVLVGIAQRDGTGIAG